MKIWRGVQWFLGVSFLLASFGTFGESAWTALTYLGVGLLALPLSRRFLGTKISMLSGKLGQSLAFSFCFVLALISTPSSDPNPKISEPQEIARLAPPPSQEEIEKAKIKREEVRVARELARNNRIAEEKTRADLLRSNRIQDLLRELKTIPSHLTYDNLARYTELETLDPENPIYKEKRELYDQRLSPLMKVISIRDAESLTVLDGDKRQIGLRLYGIDAPELGQEFSAKAKQLLSDLIAKGGGSVRVEKMSETQVPAPSRIYLADGQLLNVLFIKNGGAWFSSTTPAEPSFEEAMVEAKEAKVGLWGLEAEPMEPSEYRRRSAIIAKKREAPKPVDRKVDESKSYWLNTKTGKRHNQRCRWFGRTGTGRYCPSDSGTACGICGG